MTTRPEDFSEKANELLAANDIEGALRTAEKGLRDHPEHLGLVLMKINALRKQGRIEDAIEFAETVPDQARADWLTRPVVSLYLETRDFDKAEELLSRCSEETRSRQGYQFARILLFKERDGLDTALEHARAFYDEYPGRSDLAIQCSELLLSLSRPSEAINYLEPLITPDAPLHYRTLYCRACLATGFPEKVISSINEVNEKTLPLSSLHQLAEAQRATSLFEDALATVNLGLERFPDDPFLAQQRFNLLCRLDRKEIAIEFANSMPQPLFAEKYVGRIVEIQLEEGRISRAEETLSSVPEEFRDRVAYQIGKIAVTEERQGASSAYYIAKDFLKKKPGNWALSHKAVFLLRKLGRYDEAISILESVVQDDKSAALKLDLARIYFQTKRFERAVNLLEPLHRSMTQDKRALNLLVQTYEESNQPDQAEAVVLAGLERWPNDTQLASTYWRLLFNKGQQEAAASHCKAFIGQQTGSVPSLVAGLSFLTKVGDDLGCQEIFETLGSHAPHDEQAVCARARYLLHLKDLFGAKRLLENARENGSDARKVDMLLSEVRFELGDIAEAISLLEDLATRFRQDREVNTRIARYRMMIGDFQGALHALKRIGNDRSAASVYQIGIQAEIALETGNLDHAFRLIQKMVEIAPDDVHYWPLKARCELIAGDVSASWDSHQMWLNLRWKNDKSGRISKKTKHSLHGQILNEYRLLGDEPSLAFSGTYQDQRTAARHFKKRLAEMPSNTALALSLMSALRRCGSIPGNSREQTNTQSGNAGIPRKLFQFWDTAEPPEQVAALMEENRRLNPDYQYRRFDVATAIEYMREKGEAKAVRAFRLAPHAAAKADIFRLVLLWHEGGVFLDADDRCIAPLGGLVDHSLRFMGYQEPPMSIGNNFLAVQPHEPIIRAALEDAKLAFSGPRGESIWLASGPGAITRAIATVGTAETGMLLPGIQIIPMYILRRAVSPHIQLSYKATPKAWQESFLRPDEKRKS